LVKGVDQQENLVSVRPKVVRISFTGAKAPPKKRSRILATKSQVDKLFTGVAVDLQFTTQSEVTAINVAKRLLASGGAHKPTHYEFGPDEKIKISEIYEHKDDNRAVSPMPKSPNSPGHKASPSVVPSAFATEINQIVAAAKKNPDNIMAKNFDIGYFNKLDDKLKARLIAVCRSGFENPDSGMGAYAMQPDDYDVFHDYMDKLIRQYHKVPALKKQVNDWSLKGVEGLPADGKLDLAKLGLGETSMRVRVGRNLRAFPLPGAMTKEDRTKLENVMLGAFELLIADPHYGGRYVSLTPGHSHHISEEEYKQLVDDHIMFKDMAEDKYLRSAGIASNWPFGRGCYISADKGFIVWVGEEDHLRIMCMKKGTLLNEVFDRLKGAIDKMESI